MKPPADWKPAPKARTNSQETARQLGASNPPQASHPAALVSEVAHRTEA
jgi:hypothetical protein